MSTESTLTSKGQTTVPKAIRESLRLEPGDRLIPTSRAGGIKLGAAGSQVSFAVLAEQA